MPLPRPSARLFRVPLAAAVLTVGAFAAGPSFAQPAAGPSPAASAARPGGAVRVYLMEGSVVSGQLSVESLRVDTKFGPLEIPVENVRSFTPGLSSHPELQKRIGRLVQQLGSHDAAERDQAQRELTDFGPSIRPQLEAFRKDEDAERRTRVEKILEELDVLAEEEDEEFAPSGPSPRLIAEDTVETDRFTVVGSIAPQSFQVETPFGPLTVALKDIRTVAREAEQKPEVRKRVTLDQNSIAQRQWKDAGIRLERGDVVTITATGQLTMTPWGNNTTTGPDGAGNLAWYSNGIGTGALIGRVGNRGEEFLVGTRSTFTAKTSGTLYLAIGMAAQFANQGYEFPGSYEARVRVNPNGN